IDTLAGGGVSHRGFYRLTLASGAPRTLVARVDRGRAWPGVLPQPPPAPPPEPPRSFLEEQGIPVPRRLGGDAARRIDLLEDAGATTLEDAVREAPELSQALYREACGWIAVLQRLDDPSGRVHAFHRSPDAPLFGIKAARFATSGLTALLRRAPTAAETACVRAAFDAVVEALADAPRRLAHRDYQSRNL